jgi:hypothetical protein
MRKLIWTAAITAGLLGAGAAAACDEHQSAQQEQKQQEQKPQKKVAKKAAKKATQGKTASARSDKS